MNPMSINKNPHIPGPHIIPIDHESLYQMDEPPSYEPWDVFGEFCAPQHFEPDC